MDILQIVGALLLVGGVIVTIIGVLGATKNWKNKVLKTKIGAGAVGIVVIVAGVFVVGGYAGLVDIYDELTTSAPAGQAYTYTYTPIDQQTETGYTLAQFTIVPSAHSAGNLSLNAEKTIFSLPAKATITSHTIKTLSNATFVQPSMEFMLNPKAWAGANALDLATVYFEFSPSQQYIEPAAGNTYKFIRETSGMVNARFNNSGNTICQFGSGQLSCLLTGAIQVWVNLTLATDSCSRIDNVYDPITSIITFHNGDNTWSESFTLTFFITEKIVG
jgi:hypothetical protein